MPDKTSKSKERKKIPPETRQLVLLESGYKCANPNCRHILTLEIHHIVWVKDHGSNTPDNLLALCPNCHSLHTRNHIPRSAIETWKSILVSLSNPCRASVDLLLVLYNEEKRIETGFEEDEQSPTFRFTGDGLTGLSSLLVCGLIEISNRYTGAAHFGGGMPSFEVRLTTLGKRLVEAWRCGQPEKIVNALRK